MLWSVLGVMAAGCDQPPSPS